MRPADRDLYRDLASQRPEPVSYALRVGIPLPLAMCFVTGLVFCSLAFGVN